MKKGVLLFVDDFSVQFGNNFSATLIFMISEHQNLFWEELFYSIKNYLEKCTVRINRIRCRQRCSDNEAAFRSAS